MDADDGLAHLFNSITSSNDGTQALFDVRCGLCNDGWTNARHALLPQSAHHACNILWLHGGRVQIEPSEAVDLHIQPAGADEHWARNWPVALRQTALATYKCQFQWITCDDIGGNQLHVSKLAES